MLTAAFTLFAAVFSSTLRPASAIGTASTTTENGCTLTLTIYPTDASGMNTETLTQTDTTDINVKTDNPTGYSLAISVDAGTNDGALVNSTSSSYTIPRHNATIASPSAFPSTGGWGFTISQSNH